MRRNRWIINLLLYTKKHLGYTQHVVSNKQFQSVIWRGKLYLIHKVLFINIVWSIKIPFWLGFKENDTQIFKCSKYESLWSRTKLTLLLGKSKMKNKYEIVIIQNDSKEWQIIKKRKARP